jgi:N-acetyl-D-muramate 6-phosphate phosphatase
MCAFKAVLFDLDGTLADTAPDLAAALNFVLVTENRPQLPLRAIRHVASDGALGLLTLGFGTDQQADLFQQRRELLLNYYANHVADQTTLFPGIEKLLQYLEKSKIPWGIVTNKPEKFTLALLQKLNLFDRAACVVSGDTLSERKPHPAPLLYAAKLLSLADGCCYVGDAERDIQAAKAANMFNVAACYGYLHPNIDVSAWQADKYVRTIDELFSFLANA